MANQQGDKTKTGRSAGTPTGGDISQPKAAGTLSGQGHDALAAGSASTPRGNTSPLTTGNEPGSDQPITSEIRSTASEIYDKAKETASGTYDAVAAKATTKIEERKGEVSTGLKTLADSFRRTGTELGTTDQPNQLTDLTARYTGTAAKKIEQVADYFERKDLRAMMRDAEGFARRNPAIFLGAAFALGVVAARFLKSSPPDRYVSQGTGAVTSGTPASLPTGNRPSNPTPQPR